MRSDVANSLLARQRAPVGVAPCGGRWAQLMRLIYNNETRTRPWCAGALRPITTQGR